MNNDFKLNKISVSWVVDASRVIKSEKTFADPFLKQDLWPFSELYYSNINPLFLFGGHNRETVSRSQNVMIRDGLFPLLFFFKYASPQDFNNIFYIDRKLLPWVPLAWRSRVRFFKIRSDLEYSMQNLPRKLLIFCAMNPLITTPSGMKTEFQQLEKFMSSHESLSELEVEVQLQVRSGGAWTDCEIAKEIQELCRGLRPGFKFIPPDAIMGSSDFRNTLYWEFNSEKFLTDTYTRHFVLSRGGGLWTEDVSSEAKSPVSLLRLSTNHYLEISEASGECLSPQAWEANFERQIQGLANSWRESKPSHDICEWLTAYAKANF